MRPHLSKLSTKWEHSYKQIFPKDSEAIVRTLDKLNYVVTPWKMTPGVPAHGISMYGELNYWPHFKHFDYVQPDAPKGGRIRLGVAPGSFDSFNSWIIKGTPAAIEGIEKQIDCDHAVPLEGWNNNF